MKSKTLKSQNSLWLDADILTVCLCAAAALFIMWTFTGQWPLKAQPYNSYMLQAQSWLSGRLDLGSNYSHLELAVYGGKYFVSFPPFPSYVMLPLALIGWASGDGIIAFAASMLGAAYSCMILKHFNIHGSRAIFFSLLVTIASNWLFTAANAWVWFIAQNMAFALSMMAIYYSLKGKAGLSLSFWACSVGCRPFQALYLPILLYIVYKTHTEHSPEDKIADILKKKWKCLIAPFIIALSYMILNYARFGSILEFGHNYLPEFTEAKNGQFSLVYLGQNIKRLFRLPPINGSGIFEYPQFDGMCLFFISPIFIVWAIKCAMCFTKKQTCERRLIASAAAVILIELICIAAHKTMGGSQFGNRYTNDVLPLVFLCIASTLQPDDNKFYRLIYPLFIVGLCLNIVGAVGYYNHFFN